MRSKEILSRTIGAIVAASAVDLALLYLAKGAKVSMVVPHGPDHVQQVMGPSDVLVANALLMGLGGLVYLGLKKLSRRPVRWFRGLVVVGFILLLLPIFQPIDNPTRAVLLLMHVASAGVLLRALSPGEADDRLSVPA